MVPFTVGKEKVVSLYRREVGLSVGDYRVSNNLPGGGRFIG